MDACFAYEEELQKKTTYNDRSALHTETRGDLRFTNQ